MAGQGKSRANENRAIRQEELRAKLSAGGHIEHAIKNIEKIQCLKPSDTSTFELNKLKVATELQLRLVAKYLPDLKSVEMTGEGGNELTITVTNFGDKK